jgi:hypothetical protein
VNTPYPRHCKPVLLRFDFLLLMGDDRLMNCDKTNLVTLNNDKAAQLDGQRLAYLIAGRIYYGSEVMRVEKSFNEPGKYVVSITFVSPFAAKRDGEFRGLWHEVTLDQTTVDRIEIAEDEIEYGRRCKMAGCPFVVLAEI